MQSDPQMNVRAMRLAEVTIRIDYFHSSSDEYLHLLGVDRDLLPSKVAWLASYEEDYARPLEKRLYYSLVWECNGQVAGFSSTDRINFGHDAFMHLHILESTMRGGGLGTTFVKKSVNHYFNVLELQRIYCEPNAFNIAPNRTLQRAGFQYLFTHEATPGPINYHQVTNRWVIDRPI